MKKNYNLSLRTIALSIAFASVSLITNAQVGVGTTTPDAQLDIVAAAATGNALQVNDDNTTNASSSAWIRNSGLGLGLNLQTLNTANSVPSMSITQLGTTATSRGLDINMDATTGAYGLAIFQDGAGSGIYNQLNGSGVYGVYNDLTDHGGIGEFVNLNTNDGAGVYVSAVNNPAAPTAGGDVFAYRGDVFTNTATAGGFINGSVFAGLQYGRGHGMLINHSGTTGRNAEFNINGATNTEPAIFAVTLGRGSAILAQNQNNFIPGGAITVGDFAYTGTDVDDHIGVEGASTPVAGWGVGVLGTGNFYGVFSQGNLAATGTKTFIIDHPEDPSNKFLKHFSIESNEVLNMYRGIESFDANGKAVVSLPDYYDSVNKNPSYQLTPIGAAMPNLYIESEVSNGEFVIAGGEPNKKVSWQLTAERNDPYLQENPKEREVVVTKEGNRSGKYLTPELYNQPKEKGMFYNINKENNQPSKLSDSNIKRAENDKVEPVEVIKDEQVKDRK